MHLRRIHHVAIICSDYERSKAFYVVTLGFCIIKETYRADRKSYKLDLRVGETDQIELFSFPKPPKRLTRPEARGLRHLAFEVDDIEATVAELTAKGVATEPIRTDEIVSPPKRFTFLTDPDGLPIEIYEK
jgi:glyoxylase I family protein